MNSHAPSYHGYHFPPEIISGAVWLYHCFSLSFRKTNAPVHIHRARTAVSLGARTRSESLSCRPPLSPRSALPAAQNALVPGLG